MSKPASVMDLFSKKFDQPPLISADVLTRLQSGKFVSDSEFDQIFPTLYQLQSPVHWTSIAVAQQISKWLTGLNRKSIVDIGCGVGKLCLLLRILTDYEIVGIEQRSTLANIAKTIVEVNSLKNISIITMNMLELRWSEYDVYYLYNPFQEHLARSGVYVMEEDIEFDEKYYAHYTAEVSRQLELANCGKVLITFHGYGGTPPKGWRLTDSKQMDSGSLNLWIKEEV